MQSAGSFDNLSTLTPAAIAPHSSDLGGVIKKGILLKRGRNKLFHPWYLRTIVITDRNKLFYYDDDKLKGVVSLHGSTVRELDCEETQGREFGFVIDNVSQQRTSQEARLILVAGSVSEREEWFEALEVAKKLYRNSGGSHQYESLGDMIIKERPVTDPVKLRSRPESTPRAPIEDEDEDDEEWDGIYFDNNVEGK